MKILIQTLGSAGDTHPFIGVGKSLRSRGHEVVLFANEVFEQTVTEAGLDFVEMGDAESYHRLANLPEVWDRRKGIEIVFGAVVEYIEEAIALIEDQLDAADVLVASSLGFGSRMVRDIHGIPLVTAHLAPSLLRSSVRLPRTEIMLVRDSYPLWVKKLWWRLGDYLVDRIVAPGLNAARTARGLPEIDRVLEEWATYSPDTTLGLFPDWFGPPQPDWAQPVELTGFPLYDQSDQVGLDPGLDDWLAAGEPPVVFTAGSANVQAADYFASAVSTSVDLGLRAVLATTNPDDVPHRLPATVRHERYVPFSLLFPRSRALVSNGGVGTCAQALAAGIPHLVAHVNFDQRDNASRLDDLGVGYGIPVKRFSGTRARQSLAELLDSVPAERTSELSERIDPESARAQACEAIERTAARS
jgi:UDP:flavonoid glycosyltransferase YjiC (YdhE family)